MIQVSQRVTVARALALRAGADVEVIVVWSQYGVLVGVVTGGGERCSQE